MLSRVESDKKKAHADISMKLGKNVHDYIAEGTRLKAIPLTLYAW